MRSRFGIFVLLFLFPFLLLHAEEASLDMVLQDLLEVLVEQDPSLDIEAVEEDLRELAAHPIDLNAASTSDLEKLLFLSPDQVDDILIYVYRHPMNSIYELQLIHSLQDYEIRDMLPFVTVGEVQKKDERTMADLFRYARHEVDVRADVRNIEKFSGDPLYASVKYKLNAGNKILFGATFKRDAGEHPTAHSRYGAYLQLNDIWRFKTIVAGDYRANFGLGLVMNSALPLGKSSYAANLGVARQGLRKYNGTSDDFLRGAGATMRLGDVDISAFYSFRNTIKSKKEPGEWLHAQTAGVNVTYQHNRLRLGATAVEHWLEDSLPLVNNYYNGNYFRGTRQASLSLNGQYAFKKVYFFGEAAASQNTTWGWAALLGLRYMPVQDVSLLALARHYSPKYDALFASTFSETSRPNDEQGIYLGAEVKRLRRWKFSGYTDFFRFSGPKYMIRDYPSWGYDIFVQADFMCSTRASMCWRARVKNKGDVDKYALRYQFNYALSALRFRTQADFSYCHSGKENTFGGLLLEQVEYQPARIPLVLQARLEGFYVPAWNNRIYTYENDVLYAFSIPSVYGMGARYFLNLRYRISEHYSLYLKASDTWYTKKWAERQSLTSCHKTDIHLLLRITY